MSLIGKNTGEEVIDSLLIQAWNDLTNAQILEQAKPVMALVPDQHRPEVVRPRR